MGLFKSGIFTDDSIIEGQRVIFGYQDFAAGVITGTAVTLTTNENGAVATFSSTRVISGSAFIVRQADQEEYIYTGATKLFSSKVKVSNNTTSSITLSGIPHSSWGTVRIWYSILASSFPDNYAIPPKILSARALDKLDPIILTQDDFGTASGTAAEGNDSRITDSFQKSTDDLDDITAGTTNKHFTATDETKLDGIATGATANSSDATLLNRVNHTGTQIISTVSGLQTALNLKQNILTEGAFVDGDKTKLDGIATGATADQTKADIDALNINADQVDGLEANQFVRSDANDTITGNLNFTSITAPIKVNAVLLNNTENNTSYYTEVDGILAFDNNFSFDDGYGTDAGAPATVFSDDGGGILTKNEDGWGAVYTSQNSRWASPTWENSTITGNCTANVFVGTYFMIFAEESGHLSITLNGGFQWSFGNGDTTPSGKGIPFALPCELVGIGLNTENSVTSTTVEIEKTGVLTGKSVTIASGTTATISFEGSPISFVAGDIFNIKTTSASASSGSSRVSATFRKPSI